jgi:hypothetical protein
MPPCRIALNDRICEFPCKLRPGDICHVPLTCPEEPRGWVWDGNREAPTLTPSIACHGYKDREGTLRQECGLHMHIRDGQVVPC